MFMKKEIAKGIIDKYGYSVSTITEDTEKCALKVKISHLKYSIFYDE